MALPAWNLKDLFSSPEDPLLKRSLKRLPGDVERFARATRRKLKIISKRPDRFLATLQGYERLMQRAAKPVLFASLRFAEDASDEARGAFLQRMKGTYTEISKSLVFFELELMSLPVAALRKLARSNALRSYKNYLEKIIQYKKHKLPEEQEKIIRDLKLTGRSAFVRLFDQEFSHKRFTVREAGREKQLTQSEVLHLLSHPNRTTRRMALQSVMKGLKDDLWRLGYIFNTLGEEKRIEDDRRGFSSPESSRNLENEIDERVVETLTRTVTESYPLIQQYYRLKARLLGINDFSLHDRYAPYQKVEQRISFEKAEDLVVGAFRNFSPEFGKLARDFFRKRWIDAKKRRGKRGGAFCSYITPDLHPYVFINYEGGLKDVFTLAHELGHALHACEMRGQSYLNFDTPLTLAESASTFAELLLFRKLRKALKTKQDRIALLLFKIDNIIATTYRQTSMHLFEGDFHRERRKQGELSLAAINELWQARQRDLYGRAVKLPAGSEVLWSYVPHFLHTPFYVYAYSFGELLALSLFALYEKSPRSFPHLYRDFLALGGTASPQEALARFSINLHDARFWRGGIAVLEELINELRELTR